MDAFYEGSYLRAAAMHEIITRTSRPRPFTAGLLGASAFDAAAENRHPTRPYRRGQDDDRRRLPLRAPGTAAPEDYIQATLGIGKVASPRTHRILDKRRPRSASTWTLALHLRTGSSCARRSSSPPPPTKTSCRGDVHKPLGGARHRLRAEHRAYDEVARWSTGAGSGIGLAIARRSRQADRLASRAWPTIQGARPSAGSGSAPRCTRSPPAARRGADRATSNAATMSATGALKARSMLKASSPGVQVTELDLGNGALMLVLVVGCAPLADPRTGRRPTWPTS